MKLNKYLLVLVATVFGLSCSPTTAPNTYTAPPKQESSRPRIQNVDQSLGKVSKFNAELDRQLEEQRNTTKEQKREIEEAIVLAEQFRLKAEAQELISQIETADMLALLGKVKTRNLFLEDSVFAMKNTVQGQAEELTYTQGELQKARDLIISKENEADTLRSQNTDYERESEKFQKIAKENIVLHGKVKQNGVYKLWFFIVLGMFVGYIALTVFLKVMNPLNNLKLINVNRNNRSHLDQLI